VENQTPRKENHQPFSNQARKNKKQLIFAKKLVELLRPQHTSIEKSKLGTHFRKIF
jgi:hypothetical protein